MPEATNALPKEIISSRHFKVLEVLVKDGRFGSAVARPNSASEQDH